MKQVENGISVREKKSLKLDMSDKPQNKANKNNSARRSNSKGNAVELGSNQD